METKKNITVQERIDFVNFVAEKCTVEGQYVPALFDFAWRAGVVKYFAPKAWEKLGEQDNVCDFVYSRAGFEIVEEPNIAEVTAGLYDACQEEVKHRREMWMTVYESVAHPDPLDRVADAFEEIVTALKDMTDTDKLVEIAKKAGLVGEKPTAEPKEPIVLDVVKKE